MTVKNFTRAPVVLSKLFFVLALFLTWVPNSHASPSGYSQYFVPGEEEKMAVVFEDAANNRTLGRVGGITKALYSAIGITSWSDNTRIYIDHWEDGYEFNPDDPLDTADEVCPVQSAGAFLNLISQDVPSVLAERTGLGNDCLNTVTPCATPITANGCYYDGKDLIYVAGGSATLTRTIMPEQVCNDLNGDGNCVGGTDSNIQPDPATPGDGQAATVQALAWEVYPVRPQLTTYIMPFGEDLFAAGMVDFDRVLALVQATEDNTSVQVDFDADGTYDAVDANLDGDCNDAGDGTIITLNMGQTLLLTRNSDGNGGTGCGSATALNTQTFIQGTSTLQVNYISANAGYLYDIRGYAAFPRGFWDDEYYAPVDSGSGGHDTDIYIHNPWGTTITIDYQNSTGSGSLTVPANSTVSFYDETGAYIPNNSSVYLRSRGGEAFWAVSAIDTEDTSGTYNWSYPLVPAYLLDNEYFVGYAPGSVPVTVPADYDNSGLFIATVQDNTTVFVDYDADGLRAPVTYTLNRLQTQFIYDPVDGDLAGTSIISTGPFIAAWGENPETATVPTGLPALDAGYVALPGRADWIDLALIAEKATDPVIIGTGTGQTTKYTITVSTDEFDVEDIRITDILATGWAFCTTTTTPSCPAPVITFPDLTTSNDTPSIVVFNVIDGRLDIDGNGVVNTSDDGTFDGITVIDGYLDMNESGTIDAGDDGNAGRDGTNVINGGLDINGSGTITGTDDALNFTGRNLTWDSTRFTGGQIDMAPNQTMTIEYYAYTSAAHTSGSITVSQVKASADRTVGDPPVTQTFTATDSVFNLYSTNNMSITKTSSVTDVAYPGDTITYTVTATNTGAGTLTGISIYDPLPNGVGYVAGSSQVTGTTTTTNNVRDDFGSANYNNNDGSVNWAGVWVESDATQSPTSGNVQITVGELRLAGTSSIYRQADLSSATSATLTLDYRTSNNIENGEWAYVEVASSASGPWTTVLSFQNDQSGSVNYSIPNGLWSATTTVRIRTTGYDAGEYLYIDNVDITYTSNFSGTTSANDPPNFIATADGYYINVGQSLTLTFQVTVDDPLATGIDQITNTAYITSNEIPLPLSASVTDTVVNPSSQSADVSGYVWLDSDRDGIRDVGEPGLSNVEVTLKDQFGAPVDITTTDGTGHYIFTGIAPGNDYYVEVSSGTLPSGLQQTAPSGHTDNRTDPFDLIAGQSFTDGDLGYGPAAGTATFGDLVWSDSDSDGIRDSGEPGLTGVIVQLWRDDDGNLLWSPPPSGTDSLITSTVTSAGGNYLFTGVTATGSEDYFIIVDPAPTGFTGTTVNPLLVENVNANDVIMTLDFGFRNAAGTYTVTDRIWYDANGDEQDDGESGIGGVTVDLLDASLNVIATTVTNANGYFSFNGVIGAGADYTVLVTDTGSILNDYYGITAEAISGEVDINNLNANLDFTVEPTEPHFGYGLTRSVSGTVFNDLDGDGSLDSGEPGMGGLGISLYNDVNSDGLLDGGDTLVSTLTTDSNGNYLFVGLNDGNYIISISSPPSGYDYTTENPDDDPAAGHQQTATITGGGNVQNKNFGYQAQTPRSVSGSLWEDDDADGIIDAGENGLEGVTIELLEGSTVIASTSTDSNGDYSFSGLPPATYTVKITDTLGMLSGYEVTYEFGGAPLDGEASADLSGGNLTNVNFGYKEPVITIVVISSFRAFEDSGRVVVQWETASEIGTVGFYLFRLDNKTGGYIQVNNMLLPGLINSPQGGTYRLIDRGAYIDERNTYKLIEIEANGTQRIYGPFTVGTERITAAASLKGVSKGQTFKYTGRDMFSDYSRKAHEVSEEKKARLQASKDQIKMSKSLKQTGKNNVVKISVTEDGLYYLDASEISTLLNISYEDAVKKIRHNQLAITNKGQKVAYLPAEGNSGIYFYGEDIDSIYTDENIFYLNQGKGPIMEQVKGSGPIPSNGYDSFVDKVDFEEDHYAIPFLFTDPEADYWLWDYIISGYAGLDTRTFNIQVYGVADVTSTATLTVYLKGSTNTDVNPDHHAVISLNGTEIGEGWWEGTESSTLNLNFSQELLLEGMNTIEVTGLLDTGAPYSVFYVDSFDLSYERLYTTIGNKLLCRGDGNPVITIKGFTDPDIVVLDVTDPLKPKLNKATTIDGNAGNYNVSFMPSSSDARYLVISTDASLTVADTQADTPSSLISKHNKAQYLIITSEELLPAAESLASYRQQKGLETMVVKLEDIMDEFNYGIYSPEAIHDFLIYAYQNWNKQPKYAVLAGEGTYDYKDNMGYGGNLIPPVMVSTPQGLFPSDNHFGDVNGDHIPEIAVGRLPVLTSEELLDIVDKIIAYEGAIYTMWQTKVLMLADHPDEGANFPADSDEVASLVPQGYTVEKIYLSQHSLAEARTMVLDGINNGALLLNYIGHAGVDRLAQDGLLLSSDVDSLNNLEKLPVLTAMTCVVGNFSHPGFDSLGEVLLLDKNGSTVAVWSPTGMSINSEAAIMDKEFVLSRFNEGKLVLGDIVLNAFEKSIMNGVSGYMLDIYNILGDPALQLK